MIGVALGKDIIFLECTYWGGYEFAGLFGFGILMGPLLSRGNDSEGWKLRSQVVNETVTLSSKHTLLRTTMAISSN